MQLSVLPNKKWRGEVALAAPFEIDEPSLRTIVLLQLDDPRVRQVSHLGWEQKVIATEALRAPPLLAILEEALEGDVVP
jgi:hypothetical protein